jgi:predicted DNA-binding protein (UPF0251 family)
VGPPNEYPEHEMYLHTKYITYPSQSESLRLIYMREVTSKQAQKNIRITTTTIKNYLQDNMTVHHIATACGYFNVKALSEQPKCEYPVIIIHIYRVDQTKNAFNI